MEEIVEIFGKRLKIVTDNDDNNVADYCDICAVADECWETANRLPFCRDTKGKVNRHFEEVKD